MKTKEIIKIARGLAKSFRVSKGKDFRLKDIDPNNTLEFTKEADKPRAKEALASGVLALADLQDKLYARSVQTITVQLTTCRLMSKSTVWRCPIRCLETGEKHSFIRTRKESHLRAMAAPLTCR
jgi:hypothetical protein